MKYLFCILLGLGFFTVSCRNEETGQVKSNAEHTASSQPAQEIRQPARFRTMTCDSCPAAERSGFDKTPLMKVFFSVGQQVMVCGSLQKRISATEIVAFGFKVFDCSTCDSIFGVIGPEWRTLDAVNDTLEIIDSISLPSGPNWQPEQYSFRTWLITATATGAKLSGPVFTLNVPKLAPQWRQRARVYYDTSLIRLTQMIEGPQAETIFDALLNLLLFRIVEGDQYALIQFDSLGTTDMIDGGFGEDYHWMKERVDFMRGRQQ